jgi:hypothetical protein
MTEVLRSAIAEVEQYSRVKLVPPIDGTLRGHAVADVIHLLAELVENATVFSAPHTQVLLRANLVTSGLAVEVEDRGLGMPLGEQNKMNALLADPDQVNVASLLQDGRIGLFVVSQLARRHGIHVRLQTNIYGGVQAVLVVPQGLLGMTPGAPGDVAQHQETTEGRRPPARPQSARAASVPASSGGGPVSSVPRRPQRGQVPPVAPGVPLAPVAGSGPAPLPVRGSHEERPNPAEALPGIRPDDRRTAMENTAVPPTPRGGAVRGTMGKPQLPRRRAQEHIAPQLRDGPSPRQDTEYVAGHDPGLMAAFQRGIGLAEAAHAETARREAAPREASSGGASLMDAARLDLVHTDPLPPLEVVRVDVPRAGADHPMGGDHLDAGHMDASHMDAVRAEASHRERPHMDAPPGDGVAQLDGTSSTGAVPRDLRPWDVAPIDGPPVDGAPTGAAHIADADTAHAPAPHEAQGAREAAPAPGHDLTARHDGSAPAG